MNKKIQRSKAAQSVHVLSGSMSEKPEKRFSEKELRQLLGKISVAVNTRRYKKLAKESPGLNTIKLPFRLMGLKFMHFLEQLVWK